MDQSKFNNNGEKNGSQVVLPQRKWTIEFLVGLFTMVGVVAAGYLAIGLGDFELSGGDKYTLFAEFDSIAGLKKGSSVEIAGVQVGDVTDIALKDPYAVITLRLTNNVKIREDDIASIRTKGIIGDRYVKISRGSSDNFLKENGTITETESVVDFEDIIGKIVHNLTGDKSGEED